MIFGCICLASPVLGGCTSDTEEKNISTTEEKQMLSIYEVDYKENKDGTYTCLDTVFQYKMEVEGVMGENDTEVGYVILTNNKEISFETVSQSAFSATKRVGEPEFVIISIYFYG